MYNSVFVEKTKKLSAVLDYFMVKDSIISIDQMWVFIQYLK